MQIHAMSTKKCWSRDKSAIARGHRYRGNSISFYRKIENRKSRRDWNYQVRPLSATIGHCD